MIQSHSTAINVDHLDAPDLRITLVSMTYQIMLQHLERLSKQNHEQDFDTRAGLL